MARGEHRIQGYVHLEVVVEVSAVAAAAMVARCNPERGLAAQAVLVQAEAAAAGVPSEPRLMLR